jgi:hypothetical protein
MLVYHNSFAEEFRKLGLHKCAINVRRAPYLELKIRSIIWTAVLSGASAEVPVGTGG